MVLQEAEQEIEQVVGRILGDYRRSGRLDLEASETAVRAVMHKVGGDLLEKLLNAELGYRGAKVDCPKGHKAKFIQYRIKSGKLMPMGAPTVPILYVAMDATGVPVVTREVEGRRGKGEDGKAKSREAKLGCVFTQTDVDEKGRPVRDADSTTYVGAIETATEVG